MARRYWLLKSEPGVYSFDDLTREKTKTATWEGVRNYMARNFLRDELKKGDHAFFYHSQSKPPHIAGICKVVREAYPDDTAWTKGHMYFDPKSDPASPTWFMVDVQAVRALDPPVPLDALKASPALEKMLVVQRGQRLSVMPVQADEWEEVLRIEKELRKDPPPPPVHKGERPKRAPARKKPAAAATRRGAKKTKKTRAP